VVGTLNGPRQAGQFLYSEAVVLLQLLDMLKLCAPQEFEVELTDSGSYFLRREGKACQFSAPASTEGVAKLYTVADEGTLLYVGIATQRMSGRISLGLRAMGKGGYHGYKWRHLRHPLALTIWTALLSDAGAPIRELETVEAEVAYECRRHSEQWPAFQHEIHFFPSNAAHRQAAAHIYEHAISRRIASSAALVNKVVG
jgi:hypothetical protein